MSTFTTILAILKFLAVELPKFLEIWGKYRKDSKFKTSKEKISAALVAYQAKKTIKALKDLENTQ